MKVICFGDSNTYGYDPCSYFGGRYDIHTRWVDIMRQRTGIDFINEGENGRQIPAAYPGDLPDADLWIVMLGTNDLLQGNSVEVVADRMNRFLHMLPVDMNRVCLIAPPPMVMGEWVSRQTLVSASMQLAQYYERLALSLNAKFFDSSKWGVSLTFDGVHFTQEGHIAFAECLYYELKKEKLIC